MMGKWKTCFKLLKYSHNFSRSIWLAAIFFLLGLGLFVGVVRLDLSFVILSVLLILLSFGMLLSFFVGSVEEVYAIENKVVYEPLTINSSTLNASTVWGEGDREFTMDQDGE